MAKTINNERIPLNEYTVKTINGTRYKVHSIYAGDKNFQHLYPPMWMMASLGRKIGYFAEKWYNS